MTTRRQHYVWRHYLEAWQNEDGLVHWSRNGVIIPPTNPLNIMVERDYYKLPPITKSEAVSLKEYIEKTAPQPLVKLHWDFIDTLAYISHANELVQSSDISSAADKQYVLSVAIETEENLQGMIEQNALHLLKELRQKRTEFIAIDEAAIAFFHFIAHQYFRTKRIREAIGEVLSQISPNNDYAKFTNVLCHIYAVNLGSSLFMDRNELDIIFLENSEDLGFITGDQPVVNLMGTGDDSEPTELALYYPLSPDLSCLVSPKEYRLCSANISNTTVEELNHFMARKSKHSLVANSNRALQHIVSKSSPTRLPTYRILDSLAKRT